MARICVYIENMIPLTVSKIRMWSNTVRTTTETGIPSKFLIAGIPMCPHVFDFNAHFNIFVITGTKCFMA